jgi:hypothetical protein
MSKLYLKKIRETSGMHTQRTWGKESCLQAKAKASGEAHPANLDLGLQ